ncbi:hypothetical protein IF1G_05471 [Cordyceps javanica]|uniref:Uncharacterized protein n=1 Tax=Cordyceps javanica TaxID=43265 RepID=A0A545V1R1_9HYPO|nr:hypothetical protein IF1G_05471 [Cordyceps javanica]
MDIEPSGAVTSNPSNKCGIPVLLPVGIGSAGRNAIVGVLLFTQGPIPFDDNSNHGHLILSFKDPALQDPCPFERGISYWYDCRAKVPRCSTLRCCYCNNNSIYRPANSTTQVGR